MATNRAALFATIGVVAALAIVVAIGYRPSPDGHGAASAVSRADSVTTAQPDTALAADAKVLAPPNAEPPVGMFYYLVDVSASTKTAAGKSAFEEGVSVLKPIFETLRSMDEVSPQRHRVGTIGTVSLSDAPHCDVYVAPKTLFTGGADSGRVTQAMRRCEYDLRSMPPEGYTDITDALVNAGLSLQGKRKALRGIIVISDLEEDSPPGTVPGTPDVRGACVALYTVVTQQSARNPKLMDQRATEWTSKLKEWGAKNVYSASTRGFDALELKGFLQGCEGG